jgi:hypothetical protein
MDSFLNKAKDLANKVNPDLAAQIEQAKNDFGAAYADAARSLGERAKGEIGSFFDSAVSDGAVRKAPSSDASVSASVGKLRSETG